MIGIGLDVEELEKILKDNLEKRTKSSCNPQRTLQRQFALLDLNGDKEVDLAEFKKALEPFLHGAGDEEVEELFARWDVDGSGKVDSKEFVQALFLSKDDRRKLFEKSNLQQKHRLQTSVKANDILEQARRRR